MIGLFMKCNVGLKWIKERELITVFGNNRSPWLVNYKNLLNLKSTEPHKKPL